MTTPSAGSMPSSTSALLSTNTALLAATLDAPPPVTADVLKGVVTAVSFSAAPHTISVQISGDTSTTVAGVTFIDSYSPVVGDTVLLLVRGSALFALGQTSDSTNQGAAGNGWQTPTLGSGFTTDGNGNGSLHYRLVVDHGDLQVQWRGSVAVSGTPTAICTLPSGYLPSSTRSIVMSTNTNGPYFVQVDFNTDGTVVLIPSSSLTTSVDPADNTSGTTAFSDAEGNGVFHAHTYSSGVFGSHLHALAGVNPAWISFNNARYFL